MPPSPPRRATRGDPPSPTVSVVIPAFNEERNLPLVLEGLPDVDEVIVVDGGSTDDTIAVAREVRPDAVIVRQTRRGKGNALACGFAVSRGDIVVTLNADGSTDPGELPRFVDALLSGAEVAHGSRFREGGGQLDGRRLDRLGNRMFSQVVNVFFGTRFTDLGYGYNAYWRTLLPSLDLPSPEVAGLRRNERLWGDGPEIEPLINIRMAAQGLRVVEVASVGYPPIHGARERHALRGAQRAVRAATAEYIRRWRIGGATPAPAARSAAAPGGPRPMATRSGGGRTGATRSGGVPSALARSQRRWQTDTESADPRSTPAPPAGTRSAAPRSAGARSAQARSAEIRPAEVRPAAPPREPGSRSQAKKPAQSRDTPQVPRRQRRTDEAAGSEPAAATWVEGEESMGRHSADESGRRATSAEPDRRRGYPEPGHSFPEATRGAAERGRGYPEATYGPEANYGAAETHWRAAEPRRGYPEPTRGGTGPIRGGAEAAPGHLAPGIRHSYPEPVRGQHPSGEFPAPGSTGTRHSYAEPTWSRTPAAEYPAPDSTGTRHNFSDLVAGSGRPSTSYPGPPTGYSGPASPASSPPRGYAGPTAPASGMPRGYAGPTTPASGQPRGYAGPTAPASGMPRGYAVPAAPASSPTPGYAGPAAPASGPPPGYSAEPTTGRRARRRAAEEAQEPDRGVPHKRRRYPEPAPADEYPEPNRGAADGRRAYPEPDRERRSTERRQTYRAPGQDGAARSWHIPDEPWRGTEVPWRGPDGEYHTGQFDAITDDDPAEPRDGGRPDLTVILGGGVTPDVREYDSDYEGRDVPPLVPDPPPRRGGPPPHRDGGHGRAEQARLPQQPRSPHLRSLPGQPYGRMEHG